MYVCKFLGNKVILLPVVIMIDATSHPKQLFSIKIQNRRRDGIKRLSSSDGCIIILFIFEIINAEKSILHQWNIFPDEECISLVKVLFFFFFNC